MSDFCSPLLLHCFYTWVTFNLGYPCCGTGAAGPPAAEEAVVSHPKPSSAIQDDAKIEVLEPMAEKLPAATPSHDKTGTGTTGPPCPLVSPDYC